MAEAFPSSLSECWMLANFKYQEIPNVIRSTVDAGVPKVRRRYTKAYVSVSASMAMDSGQLKTFLDFYDLDLQSGVLRFNFSDPVSNTLKEYRFVNPPFMSPLGEGWLVDMSLEMFK